MDKKVPSTNPSMSQKVCYSKVAFILGMILSYYAVYGAFRYRPTHVLSPRLLMRNDYTLV